MPIKDSEEMSQYDRTVLSYLRNPSGRSISELLGADGDGNCNDNHELFGFLCPSRHTTNPTLNLLPPDHLEEVGQEPELAYSIPDGEGYDDFDAITELMPSRKSSTTSVCPDYYATIRSAASPLGDLDRSELIRENCAEQ